MQFKPSFTNAPKEDVNEEVIEFMRLAYSS